VRIHTFLQQQHELEPPQLFEVLDRAAHEHCFANCSAFCCSVCIVRSSKQVQHYGTGITLWICAVIVPHLFVSCSPTA
jgi:hypothetical protein